MQIRVFREPDRPAVVRLWREVFPDAPAHNDPNADIDRKLLIQPDLFFVAVQNDTVIGTVMAGYEGHRGWVNYVVVHPLHRHKGVGTALMRAAEAALANIGCPKINLQIRANNAAAVAFYQSLGYTVEERVSMGKRLT